MTQHNIEATIGAIAELDQQIDGQGITRLSAPVSAGGVIFPVESAFGWADSGRVVVAGVLYLYTSRTDTSLEGITWTDGETVFNGAAVDIVIESRVVDASQNTTALDFVRRGFLVNYATNEDLNVIGRNLGVPRFASVGDDDIFRAVIKALAYSPRGTVYAIELLMDALAGAGNYEIVEDLINHPNEVFIKIIDFSFIQSDQSAGKAYLSGRENRPAASATSVVTNNTPLAVGSVRFKDEDHTSDFRSQKPSAETLEEYDGDPGTTLWTFQGTNETTEVILTSGDYITINDLSAASTPYYQHAGRVQPGSRASINVLFEIPTGTTLNAVALQWFGIIDDGVRSVGFGIQNVDATYFNLGFVDSTGGFSSQIQLSRGQWYEVTIRKFGTEHVELYVNGSYIGQQGYTSFAAGTVAIGFRFGAGDTTAATVVGRVKQVGFFSYTAADFWSARGSAGSVATANPTQFDLGVTDLISGDVGKRFEVSGGTTQNGQNGYNNGVYEVATYVSSQVATLKGIDQIDGFVETANPLRFNAEGRVFKFPDDLGKTIVISGSASNDGSYVIDKLLDPDTLTDLETFATIYPTETDVAEVVSATFVTESGLTWRLDPNFITESSLDWELSDAGSFAGTTATLRQSMPAIGTTRILQVLYTEVLSAQIMAVSQIINEVIDSGPPVLYEVYPFYVSDPLGPIRGYLELVTVAGVIPSLLEE